MAAQLRAGETHLVTDEPQHLSQEGQRLVGPQLLFQQVQTITAQYSITELLLAGDTTTVDN
jgi:hypothetical protein